MYKYRVPATCANLGIGFDAIGLAVNIYNYYEIEENEEFIFSGFLNTSIKDNLFYVAYQKTCLYYNDIIKPLKVSLKANIPIARGLGSSSAIIVGGILAYYHIYHKEINKEDMLKIAVMIEGHPDNVAPCIYGGLCINQDDKLLRLKISNKWYLSIIIPNYEVKTTVARQVIKQEVSLTDCVNNIASALIGIEALKTFDVNNVTVLNNDKLHEPYRKELIKDYQKCRQLALQKGAKAFLISGSGSSMLIISDKNIDLSLENMEYRKVKVDYKGAI